MYYRGKHHRISPIELLVLRILKEGPLYGNEIINKLQTEFENTSFKATSGTIYPILKKFKFKNWITEESEENYKKKYNLTEEGQNKLTNILDDDVLDHFMGFYNKFSEFFYGEVPEEKASLKNVILLKKEIERLERQKEFLEKNLARISANIANKKAKLKDLDEKIDYFKIPIE